jgi:hypothetical protein
MPRCTHGHDATDCKVCGEPKKESDYYDRKTERVVTPDGDSYCTPRHQEVDRERKRYSWL